MLSHNSSIAKDLRTYQVKSEAGSVNPPRDKVKRYSKHSNAEYFSASGLQIKYFLLPKVVESLSTFLAV